MSPIKVTIERGEIDKVLFWTTALAFMAFVSCLAAQSKDPCEELARCYAPVRSDSDQTRCAASFEPICAEHTKNRARHD